MRIVQYTLIAFLLGSSLASCNKVLDTQNLSGVTPDDVWKDPNLTRLFLDNIYGNRPGFDNANPPIQDNITDEARIGASTGNPFNILQGSWNASSNYFDYWGYADVRKCNEFLAALQTKATLPAATKTQYAGECRFLRALIYFDMVRRYGGVPIITRPQALTDSLNVKRNTIDECFQFMAAECDSAASLLPYKDQMAAGRANKGAALALKSRILLFYASQFYNPNNDLSRWQAASDAALAVINIPGAQGYSLYPNVNRIFLDKGNSETIFEVEYKKPQKQHGLDAQAKPISIAIGIGPKRCPLQELVDAFPMANGLNIYQPGSGYTETNPYVNRDLRFYADVVYNGSAYMTPAGQPTRIQYSYLGHTDGIGNSFCTTTGYYQRKMVDETNFGYSSGKGSDQNWPEIRYAEVLLNYAEALNEAKGPDAAATPGVRDALNQIRSRAGITNPIGPGLTQDSMRNLIRNERYVELCLEMKRYWDLRRWNIAGSANVLNGRRYTGMQISLPAGVTMSKTSTTLPATPIAWVYKRIVVDPKPSIFLPYMYYMPIPLTELSKNPNLAQNPNW